MKSSSNSAANYNNSSTVPRFGLYEKALPSEMPWQQKCKEAAASGFSFLELSIDESEERIARLSWSTIQRRQLANLARDLGTPLQSLSLSVHRRYALGSTNQDIRLQGMEYLARSIDFALDMGIRTLLLAGADVYYEESTPQTRDLLAGSLEAAATRAEQAQVMLALENWDKGITSLSEAKTYVEQVNSPWLQLYADIGNLVYAGKDVLEELEAVRGRIAAVHLKDTLPGQLRFVSPGEGKVPFRQAFRKLAETGYRGAYVLELWTGEMPDALAHIKQGYDWILQEMQAASHQPSKRTQE